MTPGKNKISEMEDLETIESPTVKVSKKPQHHIRMSPPEKQNVPLKSALKHPAAKTTTATTPIKSSFSPQSSTKKVNSPNRSMVEHYQLMQIHAETRATMKQIAQHKKELAKLQV